MIRSFGKRVFPAQNVPAHGPTRVSLLPSQQAGKRSSDWRVISRTRGVWCRGNGSLLGGGLRPSGSTCAGQTVVLNGPARALGDGVGLGESVLLGRGPKTDWHVLLSMCPGPGSCSTWPSHVAGDWCHSHAESVCENRVTWSRSP